MSRKILFGITKIFGSGNRKKKGKKGRKQEEIRKFPFFSQLDFKEPQLEFEEPQQIYF